MKKQEARKAIIDLFSKHEGESFYYSEIAQKLDMDLELVVEICNDLMKEKIIEVAKPLVMK